MRQVTEADFRMPEFRDAKAEDYEFRADGKIVRKDRFERGFWSIANLFTDGRDFEIEDIVSKVDALVEKYGAWLSLESLEEEFDTDMNFHAGNPRLVDIKISGGSVLIGAEFTKSAFTYEVRWKARVIELTEIEGYRRHLL